MVMYVIVNRVITVLKSVFNYFKNNRQSKLKALSAFSFIQLEIPWMLFKRLMMVHTTL